MFVTVPTTVPSFVLHSTDRAASCSTMPVARTASKPKTGIVRPRRWAGSPWSISTSLAWRGQAVRALQLADQRIGLDAQVVGAPIGRDDSGERVDGRGASLGRRADDGDLVHDDVTALHRPADAIRAGREEDDEDRSRDPGQLAAVDSSQDEVADRADEQDVGDDHHEQQLGRRHVERRGACSGRRSSRSPSPAEPGIDRRRTARGRRSSGAAAPRGESRPASRGTRPLPGRCRRR